jgi:hypothetical protein
MDRRKTGAATTKLFGRRKNETLLAASKVSLPDYDTGGEAFAASELNRVP